MAETFGRYTLLRKIATGGMAEIYLARQAGLEGFEKMLVLKRILPHLAENEEFVEMFLHEARVAVRLNHPNIVQILDLGEADGSYFIAMEYIHGEDARRVWKQADACGKPIPVPLVCRIIMDAAAGLDYAHKRLDQSGRPLNIIHRDVSPQNLLISFEGAVKVVDFGIAKAADQATVTRSGVLKGKYSYMSPEQASGKEIDQRTDQFALGVVLHELLTCKRLFKRGNDIQTLTAVTQCSVEPPSLVNPRVPPSLDAVVMKALARKAEDRYRDLRELQLALEEWLVTNRHAASSAQLSAFLADIYEERLAEEKKTGHPSFDESSAPSESNAPEVSAPRKSGTGAGRRPTQTRAARPSVSVSRPGPGRRGSIPEIASGEFELLSKVESQSGASRTPIDEGEEDGGTITGSSVSRLVNRLSSRKRAALWFGGTAAVLGGLAGIFLWQQNTTAFVRPQEEVHTTVVEPRASIAALKIVTVPPGATVTVDARRQDDLSPVTVSELSLGAHTVYIELEGFADEKREVTLDKEGDTRLLRVELKREAQPSQTVALTLESEPAGAEVLLNGKSAGRTPLTTQVAAAKAAEVELRLDGYAPAHRTMNIAAEPQSAFFRLDKRPTHAVAQGGHGAVQNTNVQVQEKPPAGSGYGMVEIRSSPQALVYEGQVAFGSTPLKTRLPAGPHTLHLANRELDFDLNVDVAVQSDETVTRDVKLEQGKVQVVVTPPELGAEIFLNQKKLGDVPGKPFLLYEGEYKLKVLNRELNKLKTVTVSVKAGQVNKVPVNLGE